MANWASVNASATHRCRVMYTASHALLCRLHRNNPTIPSYKASMTGDTSTE